MATVASDVDRGWAWVAMVACFATNFVIGGLNITSGLIHSALMDRFQHDNARTALVGALHTALMNLAGPLSSVFMDRFGCRSTIIISGILFTIGYLTTAFAPSLEVSIVTCGVISGLAGGIGWTCNIAALGLYFRRYRNLAQGIALSGVGVGIFSITSATQLARDTYGNFGLFVTMAGFSIHLLVFGMLMRPSNLEVEIQRVRKFEASKVQGLRSSKNAYFLKDYINVFLYKPVLCLSISMFLFSFGLYSIFLYLPTYLEHQGSTPMQASLALSVCGVASILGRILVGATANCEEVDEILLYSGSIGIIGISCFLFPVVSVYYSGQIVFCVILGTYFGTCYVVITTINTQYVGVKNIGAALGIELCLGGAGAMLGPICGGIVLDSDGSFEQVFALAGVGLLLASFLGLLTTVFSGRQMQDVFVIEETELQVPVTQKMSSGELINSYNSNKSKPSLPEAEPLRKEAMTTV